MIHHYQLNNKGKPEPVPTFPNALTGITMPTMIQFGCRN